MNRVLQLLAVVFLAMFTGTTQPGAELIGYWPLDGDARDHSGNGHHGVVMKNKWSDGPLMAFVEGKIGKAVEFSGSDLISCGNVPLGKNGALTVAFWAKPQKIEQAFGGMVAKQDSNYVKRAFWVGQHPSNGVLAWAQFTPADAPGTQLKTNSAVLENGKWVHLAITTDGVFQKIYINGKLHVTSPKTHFGIDDGGDHLVFGKVEAFWKKAGWYRGQLDEIWIFDGALKEAEIAKIMNGDHQLTPDTKQAPKDKD